MRERLEHASGVTAELLKAHGKLIDAKALPNTEWSARFEQLMRNRLMMGALRYGKVHAPGKPKWNRSAGIRKRLAQYEETGNLECLVDVANLALLEFEEGTHPKKHFNAMEENHSCTV